MRMIEEFFSKECRRAERRVTKLRALRGHTSHIGKLEALLFSAQTRLCVVQEVLLEEMWHGTSVSPNCAEVKDS